MLLSALAGAILLALASAIGASSARSEAGASIAQDPGVEVQAIDYFFEPAFMTVPVGTTINWTNLDLELHTVTSDMGAFSAEIEPGDSFAYTFTEPGVFFYFCIPHDWMIGEITVEPSAGTPPALEIAASPR